MPAVNIQFLFNELELLLNSKAKTSSYSSHLKAIYTWSQNLVKYAKTNSHQLFAQPQLYKSDDQYFSQLTFNACIHTCLIAYRSKIDTGVCVQLVSATLSLFLVKRKTLKQPKAIENENAYKQFLAQLSRLHLPIWHANFLVLERVFSPQQANTKHMSLFESIVWIGCQLSILCTYKSSKRHIKYASALKHLCINNDGHCQQVIRTLLAYPSLTPVGTLIKQADGQISVVVGICEQSLVAKGIDNQDPPKTITGPFSAYSTQKIKLDGIINPWLGTPTTNTADIPNLINPIERPLPLQTPPSSLLIIQDQLKNLSSSMSIVTHAIEKEPTFVEHVLHTATQSNRQSQAVTNIKHGLGVLGFDKTNQILLEYALVTRLNQEVFPLQQQLVSFSALFANVTQQIAQLADSEIADQASTLAYFVLSRLFTHPKVRILTKWVPAQHSHFSLDSLLPALPKGTLTQGALVLATHWQQNPQTIKIIKRIGSKESITKTNRQYDTELVMGLSLVITKHVFFCNLAPCERTQSYVKSAISSLGISQKSVDHIQHSASYGAFSSI